MKIILLFISLTTLLTTTGCIFPGNRGGGDYRAHDDYREHPEHHDGPEPGVNVRIHAD
jgi:hypothetical protein